MKKISLLEKIKSLITGYFSAGEKVISLFLKMLKKLILYKYKLGTILGNV